MGTIKLDLYTHLTEIFNWIIQHHKFDAYEKFEEISHLIKKTHLKIIDPKKDTEINKHQRKDKYTEGVNIFVDSCKALFAEWLHNANMSAEERKHYLDDSSQCMMSDLFEEMAMFEWAGVAIGEEEAFRLQHSMRRHAAVSGATMLWFWGKFYCLKSDYWVLEGEVRSNEEQEVPREIEGRGQGVNRKVYWVTDNILEDWI